MATITKEGVEPRQSIRFGINHAYIAKSLTSYNYRWYAVVRGRLYYYINKIHVDNKPYYVVTRWDWKNHNEHTQRYENLKTAIDKVNSFNDGIEGEYPPERFWGTASPDHPIYQEGWRIWIPGKLVGPRSKKLKDFIKRAPIS